MKGKEKGPNGNVQKRSKRENKYSLWGFKRIFFFFGIRKNKKREKEEKSARARGRLLC